jgi:hypothetical protein
MAAEVGNNQAVAGIERRGHRVPEFVITRKRMEKDDGRTVAANFVGDLGVVAVEGGQGAGPGLSVFRCPFWGKVSRYQRLDGRESAWVPPLSAALRVRMTAGLILATKFVDARFSW